MTRNKLRLECDGFNTGPFDVPSFRIAAGEIVHLSFDENTFEASRAGDEIVDILSKQLPTNHVRAPQGVVSAQLATPRRGIQAWFHRQTISQWLQENANLPPGDADSLLESANLKPQWAVSQVAGSPRMLLGVLAALASSQQAIIVQTSGWCDPQGVRTVLRTLFDRLGEQAAVYISSPVDCKWPEFQFSATVPIIRKANARISRAAG